MSKLTSLLGDIKLYHQKLEQLNVRIKSHPNDLNAKAAFGNFESKLMKTIARYLSLGAGDIHLVFLESEATKEKSVVLYVDLETIDVEALVTKEYKAHNILEIKELKARKPYHPNAIT